MTERSDTLVAWLFERLGVSPRPPVDLVTLATRMGVNSITEQEMAEDGRLEQDGKSADIFLRNGLNDGRRRFTLAHELAHRAIAHPKAPLVAYRRASDHDAEERLCDEIAAAMLMPAPWIESLRNRPTNLSTLRLIANRADVSLSAALVRQREINHWNQSLLRFRFDEGRWRLQGASGIPVRWHRTVRSAPTTNDVVARLPVRRDSECELPLLVDGHHLTATAQIDRSRASAIALVALDEQLSLLRSPT